MGVRFCVLFVILQVITTSLGGVSLPFSDFIGKVTPVKPKPLSPATLSSAQVLQSKSSLPKDGEDIFQSLFSSSARGSVSREFSSPLILTSIPKSSLNIDTPSILNIKLSDSLRKEILPYLIKSSTKPKCNASVVKNLFSMNNLSPSSFPYPLPYPLYYNSMYLPKVRTPELKPLNSRPIPYIGGANINLTSQTNFQNLLSPPLIYSSPNPSSGSVRNPYLPGISSPNVSEVKSTLLSYLHPVKTSDLTSNIQIQKIPPPLSIEPMISAQKVQIKNARPSSQSTLGTSLSFESKVVPQKSLNPSFDIRDEENIPLISSNSCNIADKIKNSCPSAPNLPVPSSIPFISPKVSKLLIPSIPPALPAHFRTAPVLPPVAISKPDCRVNPFNLKPSFDALPYCRSDFDINIDNSRNIDIIADKINSKTTNERFRNFQSRFDYAEVPSLRQIDIPEKLSGSLIPDISSCCWPVMPECAPSTTISPPCVPSTPVTSILPGTSSDNCPETPLVPISYINVTPSHTFSQSSSDIVSSINDIVSNLSQNMLSTCTSYLNSTPASKMRKPYTLKSNPYENSEAQQISPICKPLASTNVVNTASTLPIISSPISVNSLPIVLPAALPISEQITFISLPEISNQEPSISFSSSTSPISLMSFSPPLCPSYLPSPTIPSYPIISSPFSMEPLVYKASSSKKDTKGIDRLIELMLIAELLNDDDSFEWDDLDTLLALLSIN